MYNRISYGMHLLLMLVLYYGTLSFDAAGGKSNALIFSSACGGHGSVARATTDLLEDKYTVSIVNFVTTFGASFDLFSKYAGARITGEYIYAFCQSKGWSRGVNMIARLGRRNIARSETAVCRALHSFFETHDRNKNAVDIVISVIPIFNSLLHRVTAERNIPFLVIINDFDAINYFPAFSLQSKMHFRCTLPFNDPYLQQQLAVEGIEPELQDMVGFPVRNAFTIPVNEEGLVEIKEALGLPHDRSIVMVMYGAQGSKRLLELYELLCSEENDLYYIFCCGKNSKVAHGIRKKADTKSVSVFGYAPTEKLMAVSDVLITKPGPNTFFEAMARSLPVVIDGVPICYKWEKRCKDIVREYKLGAVIEDDAQWQTTLSLLMSDRSGFEEVITNTKTFQSQLASFQQQLPMVVNQLIG